jgi:hypothetical protein
MMFLLVITPPSNSNAELNRVEGLCGGCGVRDTLFGDLAHALQLCDKTSD